MGEYNIDPEHRAWFITASGELIGGVATHQSLIKSHYEKEWNKCIEAGEEPYQIADSFENRILKAGGIKLGEIDWFYAEVRTLDKTEKDRLVAFASAVIEVRPQESASNMRIEELFVKKVYQYTLDQIANNVLYKMNGKKEN